MKWLLLAFIVMLAARVAVGIGREARLPRGQITYGGTWSHRVFKPRLVRLTGTELVSAATGAVLALGLILLTPLI